MNFGHSSRLPYDKCAFEDKMKESVDPLLYNINVNNIANCDGCLSTLGPRSGLLGYGVSNVSGSKIATSQKLVDIESLLSNRNIPTSKCKSGHVNNIDMGSFDLKHASICNETLNGISSRLSYPAANYRSMSINRFFDLPKNPQTVIFWNGEVNTRLEAKDNYVDDIPELRKFDPTLPTEVKC